jgi:signal transduction histidine kinase
MDRPAILRPLDRLPSIRWKLGAVIVFAVGVAILLMYIAIGIMFRRQDFGAQLDELTTEAKTVAAVGFDRAGHVRPALQDAVQEIHAHGTHAVVLRRDGQAITKEFVLPPRAETILASGATVSGSYGKLYYAGLPVYRDGSVVGAVYLAHRGSGSGFIGTLRGTLGVVRRNKWQLLIAGAAAAVIALLLARWLARGMTQPIRDMAGAAERLARGDYGERVQVTSRDELGRLAETFNRMAAELESVERLRRDLVANVSHELKTPISALRAHLENILDGVEQPDAGTIGIMLQQSERLGRLVEQLLDLSKLESGAAFLERRPTALAPVVDRVVGEVMMGRDGSVRVSTAVPAGVIVMGDEERIHQVLFNLLDNALRFTPAGGRISVRAVRLDATCEVSVEDTGPGVPDAHRPFVFERFYRVDPARARSDGGTGIGLTIAKSVVEGHGGRVWVEEAAGGGAAFRFTLPLATEHDAQAAEGPREDAVPGDRPPVHAVPRDGVLEPPHRGAGSRDGVPAAPSPTLGAGPRGG